MHRTTLCLASAIVIVLGLVAAGPAALAAPQILAVASSNEPIPFTCKNGVCDIEISAMCLQENRRFPDPQTDYRPFDEQSFVLVVRNAKGVDRRLIAGDKIIIRPRRSFTAVRVSIDPALLKNLGASSVALQIAGGASLVPTPVEGDMYPQTQADIAEAVGPHRAMATAWLDSDDVRTRTGRLVNAVLNALPRDGQITPAKFESAWGSAMTQSRSLDDATLSTVRDKIARCRRLSNNHAYRRCLETIHDAALYRMNVEYWNMLKAGS